MKATKRDLTGRKIVAVDFRHFRGEDTTHEEMGPIRCTNPVLTLDNGRRVWFLVQETEIGEYGVAIHISDKGG